MYSLISAGVLALDLARHPAGARVTDVVERVMLLQPDDLTALGEAAALVPDRSVARKRLLAVAAASPTVSDTLASLTDTLASAGLEAAPVREASSLLATRLVGRLPDLHALLLSSEPLNGTDVPVGAIGAALDAVTAVWTSPQHSSRPGDLALMLTAWDAAVPIFPSPLPECDVPGAREALYDLLDRLAHCTPEQWADLDSAHVASYDLLGWSEHVHEACKAAAEAGRTIDVARWLLAAARTGNNTGHPQSGFAPGAMMSVVAAVQAICVLDVLPAESLAIMTGPCRASLNWCS